MRIKKYEVTFTIYQDFIRHFDKDIIELVTYNDEEENCVCKAFQNYETGQVYAARTYPKYDEENSIYYIFDIPDNGWIDEPEFTPVLYLYDAEQIQEVIKAQKKLKTFYDLAMTYSNVHERVDIIVEKILEEKLPVQKAIIVMKDLIKVTSLNEDEYEMALNYLDAKFGGNN